MAEPFIIFANAMIRPDRDTRVAPLLFRKDSKNRYNAQFALDIHLHKARLHSPFGCKPAVTGYWLVFSGTHFCFFVLSFRMKKHIFYLLVQLEIACIPRFSSDTPPHTGAIFWFCKKTDRIMARVPYRLRILSTTASILRSLSCFAS